MILGLEARREVIQVSMDQPPLVILGGGDAIAVVMTVLDEWTASRQEFMAGIESLRHRYPDRDAVPSPQSLVGIYMVPREIEPWHGSEERLHDRRLFQKSGADWSCATLVP